MRARGRRRRAAHAASAAVARDLGLTFLQLERVASNTRYQLDREVRAFHAWCRGRGQPAPSTAAGLDSLLPVYLDAVFFDGYNHERAEKLISGLRLRLPGSGMDSPGSLPRTQAALKGFRRLAHGSSRTPMARELLLCAVASALHRGWRDLAVALLLAWHAYLRLPSDLMSMGPDSLVPPAAGMRHRGWSLLLYPQEHSARSKSGNYDDGILISPEVSSVLQRDLVRLRRSAAGASRLWPFSAASFRSQFKKVFTDLGFPLAHPYQIRHGGASYDAAEELRSLPDIQSRLRHLTDSTTKRYSKNVRYLCEVAKLPTAIARYGHFVEAHLGDLLAGRVALPPPPLRA